MPKSKSIMVCKIVEAKHIVRILIQSAKLVERYQVSAGYNGSVAFSANGCLLQYAESIHVSPFTPSFPQYSLDNLAKISLLAPFMTALHLHANPDRCNTYRAPL
jgi:hypothetical protein